MKLVTVKTWIVVSVAILAVLFSLCLNLSTKRPEGFETQTPPTADSTVNEPATDGNSLQLGSFTTNSVDIKPPSGTVNIGESSSFNSADGNTYLRADKAKGSVIVGDTAHSVVVGSDENHTRLSGNTQIGVHTHFNHGSGKHTYLRADDVNADIIIDRNNVKFGSALRTDKLGDTQVGSRKGRQLRMGADSSYVSIGGMTPSTKDTYVRVGPYVHFNHHKSGNTHLNAGKGKKVVVDSNFKAGNNLITDGGKTFVRGQQGVYIGDKNTPWVSVGQAFLRTDKAAYIRAGANKDPLYVGDHATSSIRMDPNGKAPVIIGSQSDPQVWFDAKNGVRVGADKASNGAVHVGGKYTSKVTIESNDGLCINDTCINEGDLKSLKAAQASP